MNLTKAQTVLQILGIKQPDIGWSNSVLIIIDAQNEYRDGRIPIPNLDESLHVLKSVLESARKNNAPVIHVLQEGKPGGLFDPTTSNFKVLSELTPIDGETIVLKRLPNSFANTDLKDVLEKVAKDKILILAGYMTHNCVSSTARGALDLGFTTAVLQDAVASRDLPGPNGTTIPAHLINQISLVGLQERTSWIIDSTLLLGQ